MSIGLLFVYYSLLWCLKDHSSKAPEAQLRNYATTTLLQA